MQTNLHVKRLAALLIAWIGSSQGLSADENALHELFQKKCAECHDKGEDMEEPELTKNTDLLALRGDTKIVVPGDRVKSELYARLVLPADSKKRMPKSVGKPGDEDYREPLTEQELKVVADWIDGKSTTPNTKRRFIPTSEVLAQVAGDLQVGTSVGERRYLTITNWYNAVDANGTPLVNDAELETLRLGLVKTVNSLSTKQKISKPQPIDEEKTIFRINLSDYGWTSGLWEEIVKFYPLAVKLNDANEQEIVGRLGSVRSVVRADWFVFATTQDPLYHRILGLPGDVKDQDAALALERKLGIDLVRDLRKPDSVRSGFEKSGVSQGNRVIERVSLTHADGTPGYYWKSYDFDPKQKDQPGGDIFTSPLGPVNAGLTTDRDLQFKPAGSEIIFSLPNKLQAYLLVDNRGRRLDKAPIEIVHDSSRQDGVIINGQSCISCHQAGMFGATPKDEVAKKVDVSDAPKAVKEQVALLYSQERIAQHIDADSRSFSEALRECGVSPDTKPEPVSGIYRLFLRDVTAQTLAAELGAAGNDSTALLVSLQRHASGKVQEIASKLASNIPVPRRLFLIAHSELVNHLGFGKPVDFVTHITPELAEIPNPGKPTPVIPPKPVGNVIRVPQELIDGASSTAPARPVVKNERPIAQRGAIKVKFLPPDDPQLPPAGMQPAKAKEPAEKTRAVIVPKFPNSQDQAAQSSAAIESARSRK
ncbi:MAG: c-type cytochrome [Verrucomicrobiaceae bacterium]|nr:c-type cytochrome [Verrucomicrobiaceae bacterium]